MMKSILNTNCDRRSSRYWTAPFILLGMMAAGAAVHGADEELEALEEAAFKQAVALVEPSVVRIETVGGLDRIGRILTGTGPTTGVVVSSDGYIISSSFNFISKPTSILVQLPDGRRFPAEVVASDRSKMLTLLKIDADDLTPIEAADKDEVRIGQWSMALGRTFDLEYPSLSVGIVSAKNRIWGRALQTDAKVSPVNYGGPLVDIHGKVLGVLVPLSGNPQGAEGNEAAGVEWYDSGIGFAIPMQDILDSLDRLKTGEDLRPGLVGITFAGRNLVSGEPVIDRVRVESPAEKAGLKEGDRIVEVDGKPIRRQAEVLHAVGNKYAGDTVTISVQRDDETIQAEVTLVAELSPYEPGFLGILPVRPRSDEEPMPGVGVRFVFPDSPAETIGLQTRDRILRFNDVEIADAVQLADLVGRIRPGESAMLVYLRDGEEQSVEVELAEVTTDLPDELRSVAIPPAVPVEDNDDGEDANGNEDGETVARTGRFTDGLPGSDHSYWAYVPEDYNPAYGYSLMVWIHPGGDTMEAAIFRQWKSICDQRGIILLSPKAAELSGWTLNETEVVKDAVEFFQERYSIEPTRIFLHSHSNGGPFAFQLAFKYRELFQGIAVSGSPYRGEIPENRPEYRLYVHLVCGETDELVQVIRMTLQLLQRMKYPVSFTEIPERDSQYPPAEQVQEIARWADCLDRI